MGFASPDAVLDGLSAQFGVPPTRVNSFTVTADAVPCLSEKIARKYTAVPLLKLGSTLVVAVADPADLHAMDDLRFAAGCEIRMMIGLESEIQEALDQYYGNRFDTSAEAEKGLVVVDLPGQQIDLQDQGAQKSASSIVDRILARAMADRASDVHLEPTKTSLRLRMRVDGTMHEVASLLPVLGPSVVARLKVLSGMDIAIHRNPQDGRFSATVNGRGLDVRTSTFPTIWGEKAVLRLMDRTGLQLSVSTLMSGKTSTLYAALSELAESGKNVITIEDPVEYWLPGVSQGQTNRKAGFTFAQGFRAILRQDPDVIMVGEIRDPETLETAIEASLTGHLVLSTLHTNGAVATLTRLLEMGVEPYLLASAVTGVLAQRLVRRVCPSCSQTMPVPDEARHLFGADVPATIRRGTGCHECGGIGYRGRIGVYELLSMNAALRRLLFARASEADMQQAAHDAGLSTLREQAIALVRNGDTTLEEITRVFHEL